MVWVSDEWHSPLSVIWLRPDNGLYIKLFHNSPLPRLRQRFNRRYVPSLGHAPLPFIRDARGRPCATAHEVVDRWTQFFCDMEGGQRMTEPQLRERWLHNLAQLRAETCQVSITEMPSLCELEQACRRTAGGKASGLDGIPSELMKHCPAAVAKMLYTLLLKIGLHGQEPLEHKGGLLVPIWKGKLSRDLCEAFRSILISSSIGKNNPSSSTHQAIIDLSCLSSSATDWRAQRDFSFFGLPYDQGLSEILPCQRSTYSCTLC